MQNIGKKTEEMLKMVPGTSVHPDERCSGPAIAQSFDVNQLGDVPQKHPPTLIRTANRID